MQELKANTGVDVRMGPFVDVGDGFTPQIDIGNPDTNLTGVDEAELLKHNGAATVDITTRTWAAVAGCDGWYDLTLTTDDTNAEGLLDIVIQDDSDCLPVHKQFMVLSQAAYDSKYAAKDTGFMDVNVKAVSEDTTAADNLEAMYDGTGYFDDNAPAYQLQLAGLSGGLAVSQTAESRTKTQGTETLTVAVTATHDANIWDIADSGAGNGIDFYAQFDIGAENALPVSFHLHGWFEDPGADSGVSIAMQAYNFNTSAFETIETLEDVAAEEEHMIALTINHVGTVASDPGIVRIKFVASASAASNVLHINHMAVDFVSGLRTDANGYILLSDGTGTGQIALASGKVDVGHLAGGEYKIADTTGNWATAGTWSDGVVPATGDNIIIRDGVAVTVAASLDLGQFGTLEVQGDGVLDIASGQTVAAVPKGWVIYANNGTITTNYGTVTNNNYAITTNDGTITTNYTNGTITDNYGTVTNNNDAITTNYSTVTYNSGTVVSNASGGNVTYNLGTVTTNASGGLVLHNYGTIGTDNGESDVPRVTLVDTTTTNTDMVGTNNAATSGALSTHDGKLDTVDGVVDAILALLDDARTEPGQGAPPVNPDLATKIDYLYKAWRNKKTQTSTEAKLYADDGSTVDQKATVSDNTTTATYGEQGTGA